VIRLSNLIIFLAVFLSASIIDDYKNKNYSAVCNYQNIVTYKNNEKILSIIGEACVKTSDLYLLPFIVNYLKHSSIGRKNAIYFLVIFNEKKLLYTFLFDNFDISDFSFPKTNYILSIVFNAIKNKNYKKLGDVYLIKYKNLSIKMYKENDKMIIETFDNKKIKRYWFR
jgi:hypothetical protein